MDVAIEELVEVLGRARDAAGSLAGRTPRGVRAVDLAEGRRWYLCAFDGSGFLCLGQDLAAERTAGRVREVASCVLLIEHAESLVDPVELELLASLSARLVGILDEPGAIDALVAMGQGSIDLATWRNAPERAVASLPELDRGVERHDRLRSAFERFVESTEPLVERQDDLTDEVIAALRDVEQAAARAGLDRPLAASAAEAMPAIDAGADEIVAHHVTRLS
jgi:hypothetical protein